jgi:hypothetical protein
VTRRVVLLLTLLGLGFGAASALRVVGASSLAADAAPLAFDDHALQFSYGKLGSELLAERGATWGYDPRFLSGSLKSPIYYPSSKPFELALYLFSGAPAGQVFNASVFAMLAALPLLAWLAAWGFGLGAPERLLVVAMSLLPHFLVPSAGFYGFMEAAGMTPFIFAAFLALAVAGMAFRFVEVGGAAAGLGLVVATPLLGFSHPTAALLVGPPLALLYGARLRRLPVGRHLWLWAVLLATLALNWVWLQGELLFAHYADLGAYSSPGGRQHFVPAGGLLAPLYVAVPRPAFVSLVPPLFAPLGLWAWWREGERLRAGVLGLQIGLLFVLCFYGGALGLYALAPARLTLPLALCLFLPAAAGLTRAARFLHARLVARAGATRARWIAGAALAGLLALAFASGLAGRIWRPYTLPGLQDSQGYTRHAAAFAAWLRQQTDASGRLLHEETDRDSHQYYGSHLAALLPELTGRELAGGPAPYPLLVHDVLRFIAGSYRGQPLAAVDAGVLARDFSLYNVRWVLVWSEAARRRFDALPFAERASAYDKFTLYRITLPASWFLQGSGRVERDGRRLRLSQLVPADGRVTLKYHWLESLRSIPPRTLVPQRVDGDPVPFISIADPPPELVIEDDPDYGLWGR